MNQLFFRSLGAISLGMLLTTAVLDASGAERPNIVFVLADDLGYGDVKSFGGSRSLAETPNWDRLAEQGVSFTDAHSVATVCIPSRVSIMTGRYAWRVQRSKVNGPWGFVNPQLPEDHFTISRMLKTEGYHTGYIGKWHLGTRMQTTDGKNQGPDNVDYRKPLKFGPPQVGFDESFILPGSLDMFPYAFVRNNKWVGDVTAQKGWSAFNRVGPAAVDFEDTKVLDTFCNEAEAYLAEAARRDQPFFLYLALTSPHTPTSPSPKFEGKSQLGLYGDFVMETDDCLGRVMRALDQYELADDTILIATSDHGPAPYAGNIRKATPGQVHDLEKIGHFPAGPYRGYKFSVYEGGHRVPMTVRWPGHFPAGRSCDQLVGLQDLMATIADVLDLESGEQNGPDSISYLPLLEAPDARGTRRSMVMRSTQAWVIRHEQWKLCLCPGSGSAGRLGNTPSAEVAWREAVKNFGRSPERSELIQAPFVQLFDLEADPGESENLASAESDRIERLYGLLNNQIGSGRSTPGPALNNGVERINVHAGVPAFARGR